MYSLKNLLQKNPVQISGAVMALVNLVVIADWVEMSGDTVAALNVALVALLGLFVTTTTVNAAKLDELNGDGGEVTLGTIVLILHAVFFVVAIFWFVDNAGWLD